LTKLWDLREDARTRPLTQRLQLMTPEQRLDRLERIAKLFAREGRRARSELNAKVDMLINAQMRNEERFAALAESQTHLAESQTHTDRRLDALIDIIRERWNGGSNG
jgi:hypothetical protein